MSEPELNLPLKPDIILDVSINTLQRLADYADLESHKCPPDITHTGFMTAKDCIDEAIRELKFSKLSLSNNTNP